MTNLCHFTLREMYAENESHLGDSQQRRAAFHDPEFESLLAERDIAAICEKCGGNFPN